MRGSPTATTSAPLWRLFGPIRDPQTYRNALYLALRFPLGVVYFVGVVTGLALGVSLTPLLIGVPVLAGTVATAGYVGLFEARLASALLRRDVEYEPLDPNTVPLVPFLKAAVTDATNYLLLGYALASFAVGLVTFTLFLVAATLSVALVAAPLLYEVPFVHYQFSLYPVGIETAFRIETLPSALVASALGFVIAIASVHLTNLTARLHGAVVLLDDASSTPPATNDADGDER